MRVFLAGYLTPLAIYRDLASLFRRGCSTGLVIFVAQHPHDRIPDADVLLSDGDGPRLLAEKLCDRSVESDLPLNSEQSQSANTLASLGRTKKSG